MMQLAIQLSDKLYFQIKAQRRFGINLLRAYILAGLRIGNKDYSVLLQLYRPGAYIWKHTDGPQSTKTVAIELWKPAGGRLVCEGPHRTYLKGRVTVFNGADPHAVTECSGYRVSLLLQNATLK